VQSHDVFLKRLDRYTASNGDVCVLATDVYRRLEREQGRGVCLEPVQVRGRRHNDVCVSAAVCLLMLHTVVIDDVCHRLERVQGRGYVDHASLPSHYRHSHSSRQLDVSLLAERTPVRHHH